jgi:hypothetical protein
VALHIPHESLLQVGMFYYVWILEYSWTNWDNLSPEVPIKLCCNFMGFLLSCLNSVRNNLWKLQEGGVWYSQICGFGAIICGIFPKTSCCSKCLGPQLPLAFAVPSVQYTIQISNFPGAISCTLWTRCWLSFAWLYVCSRLST